MIYQQKAAKPVVPAGGFAWHDNICSNVDFGNTDH
jgi:hypothetical protein